MTEDTTKAPLQMASPQKDDKKNASKDPKKDTKEGKKKALTFTLSFSSVTTVCVVLLGGIFMAFMLGVMVGRGESPEAHMAPLSTLLPSDVNSAANSAANLVEEQGANGSLSMEGTENGQETQAANEEVQKVMPAEDLHYARELKTKPGQENTPVAVNTAPMQSTQPQRGVAPVVAGQQGQQGQEAQAMPQVMGQVAAPAPSQTPTPSPAQAPVQAPAAQADPVQAALEIAKAQQVFDYIFQVATFTKADSVDRLRERLEGENFRTRMEKSGKFFRVLVLLRGNETQAQALRKRMVSLKLGEPMQKSKKAVK